MFEKFGGVLRIDKVGNEEVSVGELDRKGM